MKVLFLAFICLFSSFVLAEQKIETIQLNHRLATEVLPEVQAFLPKNASARAFNEFIILKAENSVIVDIKQLINKLDTPLQRLRISILRTDEKLTDQYGNQLSADISVGSEGNSGRVSVQRWSTNNARNKQHSYQAQGLAGKPMLIMIGQDIPQKEQFLFFNANGDIALQSTTRYLNIDNGFQAIARVLPNHQVTIDIHPRFSDFNRRNGNIDRTELISSLSGPVGTWLELGQIDNENNIEKQGVTSYHSRRQHQQTIYIKVDQL
ncbi:MAG: hypothetical protein GQ548_03305 [Methylophaga sp.]|nr:hypothetical protein [Methylophaga sp.]